MDALARYIDAERLFGRHGAAALDHKGRTLFRDAPFAGGDALEIGAGEGLLSLWLLFHGARSVVALEPEADGATSGVTARAERHRDRLGVADRMTYLTQRLDEYRPDPPNRRFRLILSHASINHLDEDACVRLREDASARATYERIFRSVHDLLEPGGSLVISDVAPRNAWARAGLASPWAPEIEWHKHQEPETWCEVLAKAGLEPVAIRWPNPFYRLRRLRSLLEHRATARLTGSVFMITARRPAIARSASTEACAG